MAYCSSNYSSNKGKDVGFSCLSSVPRDLNPAARSQCTLSAPVYSYRPVSSTVGNSHCPSRSQEYEHRYPTKQADTHPELRERRYYNADNERRYSSRVAALSEHHHHQTNTAPIVNPFDQSSDGFIDGTSSNSIDKLGNHTAHSVPSIVESETSDGMYSADDIKNLYSHEQDTIQERSSAVNKDDCYPYDQQKQPPTRMENNSSRYPSSIKSPVEYKQPPQFHQPLYLKKPPPDLAPPAPAAAVSRPIRGALRSNCNFSCKLLEVAPGEHMRLRGARETWHAIQHDFFMPCGCICCTDTIFCIQDASYVLCPSCKVISRTEHDILDGSEGGVGLGFKMEDLANWQNQIVYGFAHPNPSSEARIHHRSRNNMW